MERLALDRHYFAQPGTTRCSTTSGTSSRSRTSCGSTAWSRSTELATEYVDSQLAHGVTFDGSPLCCHASTRRGTACQRVPLPGSKYCPSHKHLDE